MMLLLWDWSEKRWSRISWPYVGSNDSFEHHVFGWSDLLLWDIQVEADQGYRGRMEDRAATTLIILCSFEPGRLFIQQDEDRTSLNKPCKSVLLREASAHLRNFWLSWERGSKCLARGPLPFGFCPANAMSVLRMTCCQLGKSAMLESKTFCAASETYEYEHIGIGSPDMGRRSSTTFSATLCTDTK